MNFVGCKNRSVKLGFSEALVRGLTPEGGLFVPETFPKVDWKSWRRINWPRIANEILRPYFVGDSLESGLKKFCESAFQFPLPLKRLDESTSVLELFHGPTCAFKDVGAQFLASLVSHSELLQSQKIPTVIVATSGDTGGAVGCAFSGKEDIEVIILYPKNRISKRQEIQLTCWQDNIRAFAVAGNFDDCQKLAKEAISNSNWLKKRLLISANSISLGRLLPQMVYYAGSSVQYFLDNKSWPSFIIPSGNLGNAVAAFWAKQMGFPIEQITLATNANQSIESFFRTGEWRAFSTVSTLANAMDVGNPSNMERLRCLYKSDAELAQNVKAVSVSDDEIRRSISDSFKKWGEIFCPHTATAAFVANQELGKDRIIVATAHPAKFETIVEPIIGRSIEIPESLKKILSSPILKSEIQPSLSSLENALEKS